MTTLIESYGGPQSNAYVSLTFADSFLSVSAYAPAVWTAATTTQREAAIKQATRDVDAFTYVGERYYNDQYLKFPREFRNRFPWNRTETASLVGDNTQYRMQRAVQEATCFQAYKIVAEAGSTIIPNLIQQGVVSKAKQVGPISESVNLGNARASGTMRARMDSQAYALLQEWMTSRRIYRK